MQHRSPTPLNHYLGKDDGLPPPPITLSYDGSMADLILHTGAAAHCGCYTSSKIFSRDCDMQQTQYLHYTLDK